MSGSTSLFVYNLPFDWTETKLKDAFAIYGTEMDVEFTRNCTLLSELKQLVVVEGWVVQTRKAVEWQ